MLINKIKKYINNLGLFYTIKLLFFIKICKINNNFKISIKTKKTGKDILLIRPSSTDIYLINNLLLDDGEYDFIYQKKYSWIKDAKVIIDAGACVGMFSRMVNEISNNSFIIAIEPEINNFNILKENLKKYNNIVCKQNGLWNKKCNLIVEPSKKGEWGFSVKEIKKDEKSDISAICINDLIKEYKIDIIDVLKVDIEGSEVEVFDNTSEEWLNKVKMCIIEFHDRIREKCSEKIIDKMKQHDFDYVIYKENYVFINKKLI